MCRGLCQSNQSSYWFFANGITSDELLDSQIRQPELLAAKNVPEISVS